MELKSKRIKLDEGIYLNLVKTDKFKSNLLSCYFTRPLNKEEVTKNALLPLVLKNESKRYPTTLEMERRLEELYGANLSSAVNKRGEKQILRFTIEWAKGDYLKNKKLDHEAVDMLKEIIFNPLINDHGFEEEPINREKENLKKIIEGRINDKRNHAIERCLEEMCKTEKFGIHPLGYIEDLEKIDGSNLYHHYNGIISTSNVEIFYIGSYDDSLLEDLKSIDIFPRGDLVRIPNDVIIKSPQNKKIVKELFDVNQGKLVIGYRAGIDFKDELYNPLLLASEILGGGPNSKLFKNIREKESLAYYIGSRVLKYKSIILIDGGIEFNDYDRTVALVSKDLEELKIGNFTDNDMEVAVKSIISSTESIKDSIFLISEFFFSKILSEDDRSLEEILDSFKGISKEDIIRAANEIEIDTIYFMDKLR